jgi:hypothetical protein
MARREYIHTSLSGNTATELIARDKDKDLDIYSMTICNTHASDEVALDLFLRKKDAQYRTRSTDWDLSVNTHTDLYVIKNVIVDATNTLVLESNEIEYDGTEFSLYAQLNNSDSETDIIINFKR